MIYSGPILVKFASVCFKEIESACDFGSANQQDTVQQFQINVYKFPLAVLVHIYIIYIFFKFLLAFFYASKTNFASFDPVQLLTGNEF